MKDEVKSSPHDLSAACQRSLARVRELATAAIVEGIALARFDLADRHNTVSVQERAGHEVANCVHSWLEPAHKDAKTWRGLAQVASLRPARAVYLLDCRYEFWIVADKKFALILIVFFRCRATHIDGLHWEVDCWICRSSHFSFTGLEVVWFQHDDGGATAVTLRHDFCISKLAS